MHKKLEMWDIILKDKVDASDLKICSLGYEILMKEKSTERTVDVAWYGVWHAG